MSAMTTFQGLFSRSTLEEMFEMPFLAHNRAKPEEVKSWLGSASGEFVKWYPISKGFKVIVLALI